MGRKELLFFTSFLNHQCWWFEKCLRGSGVTFRSLLLRGNFYPYVLGTCSGHPGIVGYAALCHSCWSESFLHNTHECWHKAGRMVLSLQVRDLRVPSIRGWYHLSLSLISKAIFNHSMKCNTVQQEWQRISHSEVSYSLGSWPSLTENQEPN